MRKITRYIHFSAPADLRNPTTYCSASDPLGIASLLKATSPLSAPFRLLFASTDNSTSYDSRASKYEPSEPGNLELGIFTLDQIGHLFRHGQSGGCRVASRNPDNDITRSATASSTSRERELTSGTRWRRRPSIPEPRKPSTPRPQHPHPSSSPCVQWRWDGTTCSPSASRTLRALSLWP